MTRAPEPIEVGRWVRILDGEHRGRKALVLERNGDDVLVQVEMPEPKAPWRAIKHELTLSISLLKPSAPGASQRIFPPFMGARFKRRPPPPR